MDLALRIVAGVVAIIIALNALDDLFIDLNYFGRGLHRRRKRAIGFADLGGPQQRIAIMVPAWQESAVISQMLDHNLRSLEYDRFTIFCGTYQNDPATQSCVERVASRTPMVRKVVVPHDGPTSKADCLNWIYQGVLLEEERQGAPFDILLMHDAEDVIHPLALRLYNALIPRHDFVQTPVFSLPVSGRALVAGTYIDEFGEHHLKDMLVREAIGGLIPSAGVGSGFSAPAFREIAAAAGQKPFNVASLTEDYEIGFKFRLAGKKVCFACRSLLHTSVTMDGRSRVREEYLATREYFPSDFRSSIKQRSRWLCGITLQAWTALGWRGSPAVLYCLWRDRKALVTNLTLLLAYLLTALVLGRTLSSSWAGGDWGPSRVIAPGSPLYYLMLGNLCFALWRAGLKAYFVGRLHDRVHVWLSVPRLLLGNLISVLATLRAVSTYVQHRITGRPLRWVKTAHVFPSVSALRATRPMLGELLRETGALSLPDLERTLSLQKLTRTRLGALLIEKQLVPPEHVLAALADQWNMATVGLDLEQVDGTLLRRLPRAEAERLDALPLRIEAGHALVAFADRPTAQSRAALESLLGTPVEARLAAEGELRRVRTAAYARIAAAPSFNQSGNGLHVR